MTRITLSICLCLLFSGLKAQDFLTVPKSNPALFQLDNQLRGGLKTQVQEDTFIYRYDTLELPFIDDFSVDRFPKRVTSLEGIAAEDTTVYRIFVNDIVYRDTVGFITDSSFRFILRGDTIISRIPLNDTLIEVLNIDRFPTSSSTWTVFPPYDIGEQEGTGLTDTIWKEREFEADSATYYFLPVDTSSYYTDRSAYLNNTFGILPPSIGVVTFDGLDEFGLPYDQVNGLRIKADYLTSVPINLSNLPNNNVFFSFFFQPQGLGIDAPEREDSLVLEFFNVDSRRWSNVWDTIGFESDSFMQKIIAVPEVFQKNGFQFRFRNYANSAGAFDQWHIDYLYLNHSRSITDTLYNDIAYVYDAPSLLKDFTAMPWFHFMNDPGFYMRDTTVALMVNSTNETKETYNKIVIPDTVLGTTYYQFPLDNSRFIPIPADTIWELIHPINFDYPITAIDTAGTFESIYDIDFRPSGFEAEDFIRSNDTIIGKTVLEDYYAYDDGTAEAGYGVNPALGPQGLSAYMAVKFEVPFKDTIRGIDLYFLPQDFDVRTQTFELVVWDALDPASIIFTKPIKSEPIYSDDNAFVTYLFDTLITVEEDFFVGLRAIGARSLNIGYDLNTNNRDKIFWSQDGSAWSNPSNGIFDGSLMLRPLFRKKEIEVSIQENRIALVENNVRLYPNPTREFLNIDVDSPNEILQMMVLDMSGRVVLEERFQPQINVAHLNEGLYFLRLVSEDGQVVSKKFLIAQ